MIVHVLETIAHEIGHVLVGYGHPDSGAFPGKAGIEGSDHGRRLMRSGGRDKSRMGTLLVKKEWDLAEEWLNDNIKDEE